MSLSHKDQSNAKMVSPINWFLCVTVVVNLSDPDQEPARHSSYERHSSYVLDYNNEDLMEYIPGLFHRYIIRFHDVLGDGNCGFSSVAFGLRLDENWWSLIRQDLLEKLDFHELNYTTIWHSIGFQQILNSVEFFETRFAPHNKWMSMPNTGLYLYPRHKTIYVFRFGLVQTHHKKVAPL